MMINFHYLPVMPQVLYVTLSKYEKDWASNLHSHAFTEFIYIESGKGEICTQTQSFPVEKQDFIVLLPNLMHTEKSSADQPLEYYVLGVSNMLFKNDPEDISSYCPLYDLGNINDRIHSLIVSMYHEMHSQINGYELMVASLFLQIIVTLTRKMRLEFSFAESHNMRREIANAKNFIDNHYMENLTLDQIATKSYLSKYHLIREFHHHVGMTPMEYLSERRLEEAKILLGSTNISVWEIANEIGFSSSSYFTQRFKETFGMTPLSYRKRSLPQDIKRQGPLANGLVTG